MLIKTEDKSLARDTKSRALLNVDTTALQRHRQQRNAALRQQGSQQREMDALRAEVKELKEMVQGLIARNAHH